MRSIVQHSVHKTSVSGSIFGPDPAILASDSRYNVRLANGPKEVAEALRLRHEVFNIELSGISSNDSNLEYDEFDLRCRHLIVIERSTGRTIGTYRINEIATVEQLAQLYSTSEFTTEDLPQEVWANGIEIGRACIAKEHRGTKALLLLWKALAQYMSNRNKRYCFGCCSIFTRDRAVGSAAYRRLLESDCVHDLIKLVPRQNGIDLSFDPADRASIPLPPLFESYLRLGAKVCSTPMLDDAFGTIDFFVVFDTVEMNERYRRLFLDRA
jgi:putative hemolysin